MDFFKKSIRNKLVFYIMASITLPIFASIIINYYISINNFKTRIIEEDTKLIVQGENNLLNYMDMINRTSLIFYNHDSLMRALALDTADYESSANIYTVLQTISQEVKDVYQVCFYIYKTKSSYLFTRGNYRKGSGEPYVKDADVNQIPVYIEPPHKSYDYGVNENLYSQSEQVFTFSRVIYNIPKEDKIGLLSIDLNLNKIDQLCTGLYKKGKEEIFLYDDNGAVIYASDDKISGQALDDPLFGYIESSPNVYGSFDYSNSKKSGIIVYHKIETPYMKWTLAKFIPYYYLYENARLQILINIIIVIIFLIIGVIISTIISIRLIAPVKRLIKHIKSIQSGNLNEKIEVVSYDEIGILAVQFKEMMRTINDFVIREYELKLANKTSQLKMMQAQINPHFLNNVLQSIGKLALELNANKVYSLLTYLGQMMSYSMDIREIIVPLSKEVDYVDYYLKLQSQRFDDKLKYEIFFDKRAADIYVPKMILQPIVENCFKHGFKYSKEGGVIKLKIEINEDLLTISIEDDGAGMSEKQLQSLKLSLERECLNSSELNNSIGLANVMTRICLFYDNQAKLELSNLKPKGLRVDLKIPTTVTRGELQ